MPDNLEHDIVMALHLFTRAEVLAERVANLDAEITEGEALAVEVRGLVLEAYWLGVRGASTSARELRLNEAFHGQRGLGAAPPSSPTATDLHHESTDASTEASD